MWLLQKAGLFITWNVSVGQHRVSGATGPSSGHLFEVAYRSACGEGTSSQSREAGERLGPLCFLAACVVFCSLTKLSSRLHSTVGNNLPDNPSEQDLDWANSELWKQKSISRFLTSY